MTSKMLQVLEAIDKMSDAEKVSTMEYLWDVIDEELFDRIATLYSDVRMAEIRKEWDVYVRTNDESHKKLFRKRFFRRMYDVSAFMKTLKQNSTMSYNSRCVHEGTMWESRFRVREYMPDNKRALMNVAGYIDRNLVKAKMVKWPAELRAALSISSANFFTSRNLTPLATAGYISVDGGDKNRYSPDKRYRLSRRGKAVVNV